MLKRYRQTNLRVRVSPAPTYFNDSITFNGHLIWPSLGISESEAQLSRSYGTAMKDFGDIARLNDATVQKLRTSEIRHRDYLVGKLERDVREKLIREAWELKS